VAKANGPPNGSLPFRAYEKTRHVGDRMPFGTILLFGGDKVPAGWDLLEHYEKDVPKGGSHD